MAGLPTSKRGRSIKLIHERGVFPVVVGVGVGGVAHQLDPSLCINEMYLPVGWSTVTLSGQSSSSFIK